MGRSFDLLAMQRLVFELLARVFSLALFVLICFSFSGLRSCYVFIYFWFFLFGFFIRGPREEQPSRSGPAVAEPGVVV